MNKNFPRHLHHQHAPPVALTCRKLTGNFLRELSVRMFPQLTSLEVLWVPTFRLWSQSSYLILNSLRLPLFRRRQIFQYRKLQICFISGCFSCHNTNWSAFKWTVFWNGHWLYIDKRVRVMPKLRLPTFSIVIIWLWSRIVLLHRSDVKS